jgi:TolB protein
VFVSLFITGAVSLSSAEKFDLEVYASKFDSIPIGVTDFYSTNGKEIVENQPESVIAGDLDFSGRFHVVSKPSYDSAAFAAANAGIYIDGDYTIDGTSVILNCNLRDAVSKELIIGKKYKGEVRFLRNMVHRYCNEVVEMLFGDKGIFESRFVYVSASGINKNISVMDFDGFNAKTLTSNGVINIFPAFVSKASIIWTSYLKGRPNLYVGSIFDGSSKVFLSSRGIETSPDVSPIDGTIAYSSSKKGNLDIYTCNPDASGVKQLTVSYGVDTAPSWSPNGYQIAFTSDRAGNPQIFIMDADGANQHRITFDTKYADSPAWSPKGDKIAFMSMNAQSRFDIWVVNTDGTNAMKITSIPGSSENPTWAPDGSLIAFTNSAGGKSNLFVVKPDGSRVRQVTTNGNIKMPDWSGY